MPPGMEFLYNLAGMPDMSEIFMNRLIQDFKNREDAKRPVFLGGSHWGNYNPGADQLTKKYMNRPAMGDFVQSLADGSFRNSNEPEGRLPFIPGNEPGTDSLVLGYQSNSPFAKSLEQRKSWRMSK